MKIFWNDQQLKEFAMTNRTLGFHFGVMEGLERTILSAIKMLGLHRILTIAQEQEPRPEALTHTQAMAEYLDDKASLGKWIRDGVKITAGTTNPLPIEIKVQASTDMKHWRDFTAVDVSKWNSDEIAKASNRKEEILKILNQPSHLVPVFLNPGHEPRPVWIAEYVNGITVPDEIIKCLHSFRSSAGKPVTISREFEPGSLVKFKVKMDRTLDKKEYQVRIFLNDPVTYCEIKHKDQWESDGATIRSPKDRWDGKVAITKSLYIAAASFLYDPEEGEDKEGIQKFFDALFKKYPQLKG